MIAVAIVIHNESYSMSARHKPPAWREEMTVVWIAGGPGHVVQGILKVSAQIANVGVSGKGELPLYSEGLKTSSYVAHRPLSVG